MHKYGMPCHIMFAFTLQRCRPRKFGYSIKFYEHCRVPTDARKWKGENWSGEKTQESTNHFSCKTKLVSTPLHWKQLYRRRVLLWPVKYRGAERCRYIHSTPLQWTHPSLLQFRSTYLHYFATFTSSLKKTWKSCSINWHYDDSHPDFSKPQENLETVIRVVWTNNHFIERDMANTLAT